MGFKSYQESFKREQINGEILSECDEEVLTNDLGVTSKLHRMRMMKLISGKFDYCSYQNLFLLCVTAFLREALCQKYFGRRGSLCKEETSSWKNRDLVV